MNISITIAAFDHTFTASLEEEKRADRVSEDPDEPRVNLAVDGIGAGWGIWRDEFVNDGPHLLDDEYASDEVYEQLNQALTEALAAKSLAAAQDVVSGLDFRLDGVRYQASLTNDGDVVASFLIVRGSDADAATGEDAGDAHVVCEEIGAALLDAMEAAGFRFTGHVGGEGQCSVAGVEYAGGEYMHFAR